MRVYAVVTASGASTVELFPTRKDADEFLAQVRSDEPDLAARLSLEAIEIAHENPN